MIIMDSEASKKITAHSQTQKVILVQPLHGG